VRAIRILRAQRAFFAAARPLKLIVRFHMRLRDFVSVMLGISLANPVEAKCIHHPEIRALVTVEGCVMATFSASDTKTTFFGDPERKYRAGETLSGTLLTVSVKSAHFTWSEAMGHAVNGVHLWTKGETHSLFIKAAPSAVCPDVLPADLVVQTQRVCCDTVPGTWECLLPESIALATLVAHPRWRLFWCWRPCVRSPALRLC
jgi:hypothetical protein